MISSDLYQYRNIHLHFNIFPIRVISRCVRLLFLRAMRHASTRDFPGAMPLCIRVARKRSVCLSSFRCHAPDQDGRKSAPVIL